MKILLFTRHYPPAVSGLAPRTSGLAKALRRAGAEVFVVAPSLEEGETGIPVFHPHRDPPDRVELHRKSWRDLAREVLLWPDPDIRWTMKAVREACTANWKPDWILAASPPESVHVAAFQLRKKLGVRLACDFTDLWLENPHRQERREAWRAFGESLVAKWLIPKLDLVCAVDETIAAELKRFGARHPHVLPHFPADVTPANITLPPDRLNVVCTGAFTLSAPENGIEATLEAFSKAQQRNPGLLLHLVGRLTEHEHSLIAGCAGAQHIVIHGVRSISEARGFQAAADALLFACPQKLHVPPSKIVEYLTLEKPIIAIGEGPWRADPRTPPGDPVAILIDLTKGARQHPPLPKPLSAEATARRLLDLMHAASSQKKRAP
jgi:glycosyltransferase involved in cell wall biosynthesis